MSCKISILKDDKNESVLLSSMTAAVVLNLLNYKSILVDIMRNRKLKRRLIFNIPERVFEITIFLFLYSTLYLILNEIYNTVISTDI